MNNATLKCRNTFATLVGLFCLATAFSATAQQPSTRYISAAYQEFEDTRDFDGIGFKVAGRVGDRWILAGSYTDISASTSSATVPDVDWDITQLRAGYSLYERHGVVFQGGPQVMYVSYKTADSMVSDSETRFGAFASLRYQATTNVELSGEISYVDFDTASGSTLLQTSLGTRFYLLERLTLDAEVRFGEWEGLAAGVSFHF